MLNLDFFQPFKNIQYSIGTIYLTKLNLPLNMRQRQKNVILVGLMEFFGVFFSFFFLHIIVAIPLNKKFSKFYDKFMHTF